ncbi:MAG: hypothetical protein OXS50_11230 [Gammaproteobacteria bacterium]|nr:hypothetical protein [Gammaproteobacteria bacterium]
MPQLAIPAAFSSALRRGVPGRERPLATFIWCAALVALVALAWPIDTTSTSRAAATGPVDPDALPTIPGSEDLTAFRESERWGGASFNQVAAEAAGRAAASEDPNRDNVGLVGLVARPSSRVALLVEGEGTVTRRTPGDALPDGRVLTEVAANTATLAATVAETPSEAPSEEPSPAQDVLVLFPPVHPAPADAASSPDTIEQAPASNASR